jgi:hypothetical protein
MLLCHYQILQLCDTFEKSVTCLYINSLFCIAVISKMEFWIHYGVESKRTCPKVGAQNYNSLLCMFVSSEFSHILRSSNKARDNLCTRMVPINVHVYIKISLYIQWTPTCFGQLYPWRWPHSWPKHVGVHYMYKLILICMSTFIGTIIAHIFD